MESTLINNYEKQMMKLTEQEEFQSFMANMANDKGLLKWLEVILSMQESKELLRDSERGFVLTAYTESEGRYRAPHDHGACWVVYAVMSGKMEMRAFLKDGESQSGISVKQKEILETGETRIYKHRDIHDTRCLSDKVIILRLTSCDLRTEDKEGRMNRYTFTQEL